jgi:hypothetical protein
MVSMLPNRCIVQSAGFEFSPSPPNFVGDQLLDERVTRPWCGADITCGESSAEGSKEPTFARRLLRRCQSTPGIQRDFPAALIEMRHLGSQRKLEQRSRTRVGGREGRVSKKDWRECSAGDRDR